MPNGMDDLSASSPISGQNSASLHQRPVDSDAAKDSDKISALADDLLGILRMQFQDPATSWGRLSTEMARRIVGTVGENLQGEVTSKPESSVVPSSEPRTGGAMPSPSDISANLHRTFTGFDVERATYDRIAPELLEASEGKFVAIVGKEWVGPLDTDEEAEHAGYRKFGLGPLYIKQVLSKEPPALVTRDVVVCRT